MLLKPESSSTICFFAIFLDPFLFFSSFKRVKIPGVPFSYKRNSDGPEPRVAAFENPGYDTEIGFVTHGDDLYDDLPPPVVLRRCAHSDCVAS